MSSLHYAEKSLLEKILGMKTGYVSDFSDRTLKEFVLDVTGVDIFTEKYEKNGTSKANRVRTFWSEESDDLNANLIEALLKHAEFEKTQYDKDLTMPEVRMFGDAGKIVRRLRDEPDSDMKRTIAGDFISGDKVSGDKVGRDKKIESNTSNTPQPLSKYWWKDPHIVVPSLVLIFVTFLASDYWAPRIFGNSLPSAISTSTQKVAVELQNTIPNSNLRPLQPLETGKGISFLPNNTYFYSSAFSIAYQLENMEIDFMNGENEYLQNYSFEIQKNNGRYYVIGFISDEAYSNVGSVSSSNSLFTVLFPESWGGAKNPVAIPFDKVYTAKERTINLDASQNVRVLDIGFKEVLDNPIVHAK